MRGRRPAAGLVLAFALSGCGSSTPSPAASGTPAPTTQPTATPISSPSETPYPTPDLGTRPLVWFHPLPPMQTFPERPFIGSEDFMDLFTPDAAWSTVASQVQVFHLFGEWLGRDATDAQLQQMVADLNRRGIGISISGGALQPGTCSGEIEGFAGVAEGRRVVQRIQRAGGRVLFYAFDHAYDAGTSETTPDACRLSPEEVATQAWSFTQAIRETFPDIVVGDDVTAGLDVDEVATWVDAYRSVAGEEIGFIHVDVDFGIPDWQHKVLAIEEYLRGRGIPFGLFYIGNGEDPSDEAWFTAAGERVKTYELETGGQPDHVVFASWNDHPDFVLPETEPNTFTSFLKTYFEDKSALGEQTEGTGANLAYGKRVTASQSLAGLQPEKAVDGLFDTWWGSGAPSPQWIEIDLGQGSTIGSIRLSISQDPAGRTVHRVYGRAPGLPELLLHVFDGVTTGDQVLEYVPDEPWDGIEFIRIATDVSPSWVSWREIEVLAP
jgi:NedA-like, galactose-binding domain